MIISGQNTFCQNTITPMSSSSYSFHSALHLPPPPPTPLIPKHTLKESTPPPSPNPNMLHIHYPLQTHTRSIIKLSTVTRYVLPFLCQTTEFEQVLAAGLSAIESVQNPSASSSVSNKNILQKINTSTDNSMSAPPPPPPHHDNNTKHGFSSDHWTQPCFRTFVFCFLFMGRERASVCVCVCVTEVKIKPTACHW